MDPSAHTAPFPARSAFSLSRWNLKSRPFETTVNQTLATPVVWAEVIYASERKQEMTRQFGVGMAVGIALVLAGCDGPARAQGAKTAPVADERQVADTQEELIKLLRVSPTLTEVVERDPSLLGNAEYVSKSNPELEQFLVTHPEVARNPDFYLFSGLGGRGQRREVLEKKVWPEYGSQRDDAGIQMIRETGPFLIFVCVLGTMLWLVHLFVRNRRWQRVFKAQMDARERLIDRWSTNEQMMHYMEGAGKGLLEMPALNDGD